MTFPLTAYLEAAMELASDDKLGDGSFAGEIPKLPGVVAFGGTLRECERELRSTISLFSICTDRPFLRTRTIPFRR